MQPNLATNTETKLHKMESWETSNKLVECFSLKANKLGILRAESQFKIRQFLRRFGKVLKNIFLIRWKGLKSEDNIQHLQTQ